MCLLLRIVFTILLLNISLVTLAKTTQIKPISLQEKLRKLETAFGGRIGVSAINTANHHYFRYRALERFPLCSTNKIMGVAAILQKSIKDPSLLKRKLTYQKNELVTYSPITAKHLIDGMTISELCLAAITQSDNTAINLLMKKLGGLIAVNDFAHSIHDHAFRLDRFEPELNTAIPGDLRDTTTPLAMQQSLQQLVLGNALASKQRVLLQSWLKNNTTGKKRIRAGVPQDWIVGDKTGTCDYGTTNDVGIIWPNRSSAMVMAIYFTQLKKESVPRDEVIAAVTRLVVNELKGDQRVGV